MADTSQGDGWWKASDGKWYPPESHPDTAQLPPPPASTLPPPRPNADPDLESKKPPIWKRRWFIVTAAVVVVVVAVVISALAGDPDDEPSDAEIVATDDEADSEAEPGEDASGEDEADAAAPASTSTSVTTTTVIESTTTTTTTTTTVPPPEPIGFSGSGTDVIQLEPGSPASADAWAALLTHDGSSNFIVKATDDDGYVVDGLTNHIGQYTGLRPYNFEGSSEVRFIEVEADGNWTLTLVPLLSLERMPSNSGTQWTGSGDTLLLFDNADAPTVVEFRCANCDSNIFLRAVTDRFDSLINEIGDGSEFVSSVVVPKGTLLLEVEVADSDFRSGAFIPGDWTITVE